MVNIVECPTRATLSDYALGKLDETGSDTISKHLGMCETCLAYLDTIAVADDPLLECLRRPVIEDEFTSEHACQTAVDHIVSLSSDDVPLVSLGDYELLEKLGSGGMAVVYRARHRRLDRLVAVKILPECSFRNPESVSRFERETRAIGRLEHPNIVQAFDAREDEGRHYLVMELIDGLDFSSLIQRSGPLSIADATAVVLEAAKALQHAHDHGMVHRDMKPSNVMLTEQGKVKILDLGLALFEEPQLAGSELTASGQIMGTLDYIAPEQLSDSHDVDRRVDIYALGATLYKLLTGVAPHSAASGDMKPLSKLVAIAATPITPANKLRADVPQSLSAVLDRMLQKNPADRMQTAGEVVTALETFASAADLQELYVSVSEQESAVVGSDSALKRTDPDVASAFVDTTTHQKDERAPSLRRLQGRGLNTRQIGLAAGLLGLLAIMLFVFYVQIGKATLEVMVHDEQVGVMLSKNGLFVEDKETGQTYTVIAEEGAARLAPGSYQLRVSDDSGLEIDGADSFTIERRGTHVVSIRVANQDSRKRVAKHNESGNAAKKRDMPIGRVANDPAERHRHFAELSIAQGHGVNLVTTHQAHWESIADADSLPQERFFVKDFSGASSSPEFWRAMVAAGVYAVDLFEVDGEIIDIIATSGNSLDGRITGKELTSDDVQKLVALQDLYSLGIGGPGIDDRACSTIRQIRELRHVGLSKTKITDRGLEDLAGHPNLRTLDLGLQYEGLTPNGLKILTTIPNLQGLSFNNLKWLTDADVDVFAGFSKLRALRVSETGITAAGARRLREMLPDCLVLHGEPQQNRAHREFRNWVKSKNGSTGSYGAIRIGAESNLVSGFSVYSADGMERVKNVIGLEDFHWGGLRNTDQQLTHLASLDTVTKISLVDTDLAGSGLQALSGLSQLETVVIEDAPQLTDKGLSHLRVFRHLRTLEFQVLSCTDRGFAHLGSLRSLRRISLRACPNMTGSAIESWTEMPLLHTLRIDQVPITDVAVPHIKQLQSLRVLELRNTSVSAQGALDLQKSLPNCVVLHEALDNPRETP